MSNELKALQETLNNSKLDYKTKFNVEYNNDPADENQEANIYYAVVSVLTGLHVVKYLFKSPCSLLEMDVCHRTEADDLEYCDNRDDD